MRKVLALPSFERSVKKLTPQEKQRLAKALENLNNFLISGKFSHGFRFKKINKDKYEFRVDAKLRVITKEEGATFYLVLVGGHEQIRRYLRNFR